MKYMYNILFNIYYTIYFIRENYSLTSYINFLFFHELYKLKNIKQTQKWDENKIYFNRIS